VSLLKKLAGETALYGLSSILGRFLNFLLLTPLHTRVLKGTHEYGAVTDLYAWSAFIALFFSYRMESAFFRFGTEKTDRERAFSTGMISLLCSTAFIATVLLALAQPVATAMRYEQFPNYIRFFALILAFECLSELPFARLRLEQRPKMFVFAKLFGIGVNIIFNLFWLVYCPWAEAHGQGWVRSVWSPGQGVTYVFLSNLLASMSVLLLLFSQFRAIRWHFDYALWRRMFAYAAPLIIVGLAGIVDEMFSRSMLKYLLPGTTQENLGQVGIFGANYKLAMLITLFTQAYRYAAEPFFFRHAKDEDAMQTQALVTKWFTIASAAGMLAILLFLDVAKHFISAKFHGGLHVVPVLLLANLFLGLYYNFSVWYRLKDRTALGAWISVGGAAITVLLNLLLIPHFGYTGAAFVTLICYAYMSWMTWQTGRKHYPVPYELGRMAAYIALVLLLYYVSLSAQWLLPNAPALLWGLRIALMALFIGVVYHFEYRSRAIKRNA
jgi:O-antigen/teichoic acid export membrane protein